MRNIKTVAASVLLLTLLCGFTGCSRMPQNFREMEEMIEAVKEDDNNGLMEDSKEEAEDSRADRNSETVAMDVTVGQLFAKYGISESEQIAPFYNIEPDGQFAFHFSSNVNPAWAVTVHTDSKCGLNSMVYQINDGYRTVNGTDVIVKPGSPVLGYGKDCGNYVWGYAPVYYLCIRYDMESETAEEMENPIVVPFTVKSAVSIPNIATSVNENGQFEISWNEVSGAAKYNIYCASPVKDGSDAKGYTRAECGYAGDHPELIASVDKNTLSFKDFNGDGTDNLMVTSDGYVNCENFHSLGTYYVTAVDKKGNESLYSMAAEGWQHAGQLPKSFEGQMMFDRKDGYATMLPGLADVKMCDGSTSQFPISYEKISEQDGYATYAYRIDGTMLTGTVNYKNETGKYEQSVISGRQVNSAMYDVKNNINIIPENAVMQDNNSKYAEILGKNACYDECDKIAYPQDAYYLRADIESARIVTDGIYTADPLEMFTIENAGNGNFIEIKETDLGLSKNNLAVHDTKNTEYMIFADSAEEEFLALCMADAKTEISLSSMPKLQNVEYMLDVLYKVIYQNPYIIGVKSFSYDFDKTALHVTYSMDKETIKRQQEEIRQEADAIISSIISEGMDDEDRVKAVWDYLENNTVYDDKACETAKQSGFADVTGYEDSFSTYGIICRKTGVCQSYMYATKLLCNMTGVECEALTGSLQNSIPHGWNMVMIDGGWYWIDTTNSMTNSGVPYFIYQTSYEFAADSWNYVLDNDYELDTRLDSAKTTDMSHDYYVQRGLYAESHKEITEIIKDKITGNGGLLYIKCSFTPDINDADFVSGICDALRDAGYTYDEISDTLFGNIGQIMVVDVYGKIM